MAGKNIGILSLQGNYQMHSNMLSDLGVKNIFVKTKEDLFKCKALIIPGGESTVISKMMLRYDLFDSIKDFSKRNSVFGTCAGLILMGNSNLNNIKTLNIIDIDVLRNAWGRQINSFTENINLNIGTAKAFRATFIRAPRIKKINNATDVLAEINKEPIMIKQGRHLATTFHPEMHGDTSIHKYFLNMINESK